MTKILVVEDDPANLNLVIEMLELKGLTADKAFDGEEAIEKAEKAIYDLLIMDIGLPGIDGIETVRKIKSKPEYKGTYVIALTAFAMKGDKEKLLASGFDEYISKPLDMSNFFRIIEKYMK